MKFVDEATILVHAGKGGDGTIGFRREKFIPMGGPNGGDGGDGGSVYLHALEGINTLADFRVQRRFRAEDGAPGGNNQCTGRGGEDCVVFVPIGTLIFDAETDELMGDLLHDGQRLLVAKGGWHGLGNMRFKSSTNRAPRQFSRGTPGEERELRLELKLLADVGLLGMPNAGKSSFIRSVSSARPKVADYPFTTLHPNLGVVSVGVHRSFVIADIPGLIEGAAEGAGLGIRFLKHLQRTHLLLHLVDIAPMNAETDPAEEARILEGELAAYSEDLAVKDRWLVLNKIDLLTPEEQAASCQDLIAKLDWRGPVYRISALSGEGTTALCQDVMRYLQEKAEREPKPRKSPMANLPADADGDSDSAAVEITPGE